MAPGSPRTHRHSGKSHTGRGGRAGIRQGNAPERITAVEPIVDASMGGVRPVSKFMSVEHVWVLDEAMSAAVGDDARMIGPLDSHAPVAVQSMVNVHAPPCVHGCRWAAVSTGMDGGAIGGMHFVCSGGGGMAGCRRYSMVVGCGNRWPVRRTRGGTM